MGACISSDLAVGPDFYLPTIPADIVQMTTESSKEELAEFTALISASFCGSRNKAPDAALSWCYDPKSAVDGFLKEDPSEERTIFFDFLAAWCLHTCLRHGGCFVLKKDGKMVAAAATIPPNDKKLHDAGICEQMKIMSRTGISNLPKEMEQPRMVELGNVMKKAHNDIVPGRHLYVYAFATSIEHQGKGYGRELMQFLCDSADNMGCDAYLECTGSRNERFYGNNGYELVRRLPIVTKEDSLKVENLEGLAVMKRAPKSTA